jgi:hypothetical protein
MGESDSSRKSLELDDISGDWKQLDKKLGELSVSFQQYNDSVIGAMYDRLNWLQVPEGEAKFIINKVIKGLQDQWFSATMRSFDQVRETINPEKIDDIFEGWLKMYQAKKGGRSSTLNKDHPNY